MNSVLKTTVWVDLDNTPHVPFFAPIIRRLNKEGVRVVVTARDRYQVVALADLHGMEYVAVGGDYGEKAWSKMGGLLVRSLSLVRHMRHSRPYIGVSHGSRSQLLACRMASQDSLLMLDYEHARFPSFLRPSYILAPSILESSTLPEPVKKVLYYPGIKENVYSEKASEPNTSRNALDVPSESILAIVRPPATGAHYHDGRSEKLFQSCIDRILAVDDTVIVFLPRTSGQRSFAETTWKSAVSTHRLLIPDSAINGMDLIRSSDLVVSAGGTMNREAASLGVPVYSIFTGPRARIDEYLAEIGRLTFLESEQDIDSQLSICKRREDDGLSHLDTADTLDSVITTIHYVVDRCGED